MGRLPPPPLLSPPSAAGQVIACACSLGSPTPAQSVGGSPPPHAQARLSRLRGWHLCGSSCAHPLTHARTRPRTCPPAVTRTTSPAARAHAECGSSVYTSALGHDSSLLGPRRPRPHKIWSKRYCKVLVVGDSGLGEWLPARSCTPAMLPQRLVFLHAHSCVSAALSGRSASRETRTLPAFPLLSLIPHKRAHARTQNSKHMDSAQQARQRLCARCSPRRASACR